MGAKLAIMKEAGVTTIKGSDTADKSKYAAAMVEYNKQDKVSITELLCNL